MTTALELPQCQDCSSVQYPLRERCLNCLGANLKRVAVPGAGMLLAVTTVHHSNDAVFESRLPLTIGSIALDSGPVVIAFVDNSCSPGDRVQVSHRSGEGGSVVLAAAAQDRPASP